ncbi:transferase hexapeptide (six repeat-containing protein) [Chitinophaga sp. CF118]|uniref:acyltransferase n=1 Tax=Chitinophaga sp. CF118 TaxID=1884367 RepID=UPI0008E9A7F8|nr:acyltransferase [Chitinophaga sp. CF118]SFD80652.1 transferase hexapeptide (six repeat-containing protein) [Chitinophaga sp. CF118]
MKKILRLLSFIPFLNRIYKRQYYATGMGILVVNTFFKNILRINTGADILFNFTSRVNTPKNIKITGSEETYSVYKSFVASGGCYYQAINGIEIGEGTIWAYGCQFISSNHSYRNLKVNLPGPPIRIGNSVWIASNCVVLPGVNINDYCVVGAGSVVSKSFSSHTIIAGVPAKAIASRCKKCLEKIVYGDEYCNDCQN